MNETAKHILSSRVQVVFGLVIEIGSVVANLEVAIDSYFLIGLWLFGKYKPVIS